MPFRAHLAGLLGQRPAVLALQRREQSTQHRSSGDSRRLGGRHVKPELRCVRGGLATPPSRRDDLHTHVVTMTYEAASKYFQAEQLTGVVSPEPSTVHTFILYQSEVLRSTVL